MAELKKVSIKHQTIMDYLIANPMVKLKDVANHFEITQPWLSQVIHSDAFQAMLSEKMDVAFHHTVLPLREKLNNLAHQALDKLADTIPLEADVRVLTNVAEATLDRLGFGSKGTNVTINNQQNTQVNVLRSELDEARALLGKAQKPNFEVLIDGVPLPLSLQGETSVGEDNRREVLTV